MTALIHPASGLEHWASLTFRKEPFNAVRSKYFRPRKYHDRPHKYHKLEHAKTHAVRSQTGMATQTSTDMSLQNVVKHPIQKRTRVFLLETQNGIVQDELALWRIAAVVSKKNLRLTTCPKSTLRHSSGVATCWGLLTSGLIMLRWHLRSSSWGSALG
jgi:hypothetical protein